MKIKNNYLTSKYILYLISLILILLTGCMSTKTVEIIYPDVNNVEKRTTPLKIIHHKGSQFTIYDYFSYIPYFDMQKEKATLVLTGMNSKLCTTNYQETINETYKSFQSNGLSLSTNNAIFLCPIIPSSGNHDYYVVPLDRDVMYKKNGWLNRPDLKVINIIEEYKLVLKKAGYDVDEKVILEGFSAGGIFSYNFTMIHPEMVKAAIVGGPGGYLTLPVDKISNNYAYWPVGIHDFEKLMKSKFNYEKVKEVPIYVYWGDQDRNNSLIYPHKDFDMFDQYEKDIIIKRFGLEDPERLENICKYLQSLNFNIKYDIYPNTGHKQSNAAKMFIKEFLMEHLK